MNPQLQQGLIISLTGLSLTFAGLGGLILAINLLTRIFSPQRPPQPPTINEDEVVAAISVAVNHFQTLEAMRGYRTLGIGLESPHGAWWTAGNTCQTPNHHSPSPFRR